MYKYASLFFVSMLIACSNDSQAEKTTVTKSIQEEVPDNIKVIDIIALNNSSCLLSEKGKVFCWETKKSGRLNYSDLKSVDLGKGAQAVSIYGNSGDVHYFDTGYHGCALLKNNSIRCWGFNEDSVFDAQSIFDLHQAKGRENTIASFPLKKSIVQKMGRIKSIETNHGVVCAIDSKNTLYCPHKHLAFLNGRAGIKHVVIGEVLSCIQSMDDEVECYDMRGGANSGPVFLKLGGESWPELFDMRYVYAGGVSFITKSGEALYWEGQLPSWDKFPGMYGVEARPLDLGKNIKATAIHMSEISVCLQLSDGSATCWGQPVGNIKAGNENIAAPGKKIDFGPNHNIKDIALGSAHSCFLLSDNTIECFTQGE